MITICSLIIFNVIIIIRRVNRIKRRDTINSNDFKKIFIGLSKYYKELYKNICLFEIDKIEKLKE